MNNFNKAALHFVNAGLSVLPCNDDKQPLIKWKEFQSRIPTGEEIDKWPSFCNLAVVAGKVSGNLTCIDVDCKYDLTNTLFEDLEQSIFDYSPELLKNLVIQKTKNGGYHFIFRCKKIEGNLKLASRNTTQAEKNKHSSEKVKVLIETRGEGGYFLVDPTMGYKILQGDLLSIPEISIDDYEVLFEIARSFNQVFKEEYDATIGYPMSSLKPGDDYNSRGDALSLLFNHGWTEVSRDANRVTLRRPGESHSKHSAYFTFSGQWENRLRVFSTSTEFDTDKSYSPFAVYATLETNGDFREAAKALAAEGYGEKQPYNTEKKQPKSVHIPLTKNDIPEFWQIVYPKKNNNQFAKIIIDDVKLFEFLESNGFCRIYLDRFPIYVHIEKNIVEEVTIDQIRDYVFQFVENLTVVGDGLSKDDIKKELIARNQFLFNNKNLGILKSKQLDFLKDTPDESYKFYKNSFVRVTRDSIKTFPYAALTKLIWKNQIINRDFNLAPTNKESEFANLLFKICGSNNERYLSVKSAIGYLLHTYKDPANSKAIIFVDEKISTNSEANGGTAKSLVASSLQYMCSTWYQGKGYNITKNFAWQGVTLDTQLIVLDDILPNFPFELLFTIISNGITVEGKGRPAFTIPFKDSPKILLTTNHTIKGEGSSYDRRKCIVEFSEHFNAKHTPIDEYGHRLFEEWDDQEWSLFDNCMMECLRNFLRDGLREIKINYESRNLMQNTNEDFVNFMDNDLEIKNSDSIELKSFHSKFLEECNYNEKECGTRKFFRWIKKYIDVRGIKTASDKNRGITKKNSKYFLEIIRS